MVYALTVPSKLSQHCVLAPSAGLHVSPLQLGSTTIGGGLMSGGVGSTFDKETAFGLLDAFYAAGGNFIDTAPNHQGGLSEEWIGEWAEQRGIRDQLVIATKCNVANSKCHDKQNARSTGNLNVKVVVLSLEESLKRLRTSYVDILYVDFWGCRIPVEEVMNGLHNLVAARKVFYLVLVHLYHANMYARAHGKTPFVICQGNWDVTSHTFERDIAPMVQAEGMALALGNITAIHGFDDVEERPQSYCSEKCHFSWGGNETQRKLFRSLEKVAKEVGVEHISAVAIAYVLHKIPFLFPIIGGQKTEQLLADIKGLEISLSVEQISYIESAVVHQPTRLPNEIHLASQSSGADGQSEPIDSRVIAQAWLNSFIKTSASGNAHDFTAELIKPDGWLRDLLVFSWDNRTLHGRKKITDYLQEKLFSANITNVALDETPGLSPSPFALPFGQGIEFSFRFETPVAYARGLVRLLPDSHSGMKALSVFVMMEDLKGHEESGAESGLYGGHTITWNEVLEERRSKVESDPQVMIIGGGQSGLHVAARLKQMNTSALIVERNQRIGDNWRKRYPSLTLHTPKFYSTTLYHAFPSNFPLFIPRDKIADWLEHYAKAQDLVTWTNSQVLPRATYDPQERRWIMQVDRDGSKVTIRPKHVVVATGVHGFPHIPIIPGLEHFRGEVLHSSQFPGGQKFTGLRVVVIGAGNSSADICQDLSFRGAASVTMVQRSKTCVVSSRETTEQFSQAYPGDRPVEISDFRRASMPLGMVREITRATVDKTQAADKDMLEGLQKAGFHHYYGKDDSGPGILSLSRGGGYWLDVGCAELITTGKVAIRQGVEVVSVTKTSIVFNDGTELQADAVIFATGYTSWKDRMKEIFDPEVVQSTKEIWGLDEEDEMCGAYRPTGYPGLWYAAGDFADSRFYSKQLALHIKAEELNLKDGERDNI